MRNEGWLWRRLIAVPEMEAAVDDGCPMSEDKSDVDGETVLGVISVPVIDTSKAHPQKKRQKQRQSKRLKSSKLLQQPPESGGCLRYGS